MHAVDVRMRRRGTWPRNIRDHLSISATLHSNSDIIMKPHFGIILRCTLQACRFALIT
ncbi:hypothetical protein SERLA73DRAFT_176500 [Serpula lacrymans var. lacrymans S7.3]|uniref:Uncharacterized protein n=2 Tax=Serpula lacrymans var. lacrymans TaxID=341189 RepID=F8PN29_SERL3|nr:uncharacterized protein SERLADRAFT_459381 [Serpula lacrymans var. lacrymans S7.9]EGO03011.1 hypothetical protein SERLA73DRAFT_176500 [Serpula lacrymans var. lacrymans S7.3]EGO28689.1 hypothetical protein SERLADRAFT_459381 [Serpula lacrymans var. lacrymans S7.9]